MTVERVKRFERNTVGRDLIVGDVHGNFSKLQVALDAVGFDRARDRLFSVGDLVDRGPESDQALDWLAHHWFHAVQGNHEDFAIRWPEGRHINGEWVRNMDASHYIANGGAWNVGNMPHVSRKFAEAFAALPIAMELETEAGLVGIVHAGCPLQNWADFVRALNGHEGISKGQLDSLIDQAMWSRERIERGDDDIVHDVRAVVVGHTPMERMTSLGNTFYIDTGGWLPARYGNREFTILDAASLRPATNPAKGLSWVA